MLLIAFFMIALIDSISFAEPIVIDHTSTDLSQIPDSWIEQVKQNIKVFHAGTSHGSQITSGLERIENQYGSEYAVDIFYRLPEGTNTLTILQQTWYEPEPFFSGVGTYLNNNP